MIKTLYQKSTSFITKKTIYLYVCSEAFIGGLFPADRHRFDEGVRD